MRRAAGYGGALLGRCPGQRRRGAPVVPHPVSRLAQLFALFARQARPQPPALEGLADIAHRVDEHRVRQRAVRGANNVPPGGAHGVADRDLRP